MPLLDVHLDAELEQAPRQNGGGVLPGGPEAGIEIEYRVVVERVVEIDQAIVTLRKALEW